MENPEHLIGSLKSVRHFQKLSIADLTAIVTAGRMCRAPAGAQISVEGEPCAGMFVLLRGLVHLCKTGPQGQTNIMAVIQPVIMFNEITVLDGGPNPVTAIAVKDCLLWHIGYEAFQRLLERIPQVGLSLLRVLAARNRQMVAHYENLSFHSVVARVARLLLELSDEGGRTIHRRDCSIEEMASRAATVPEAVSRSLSVMKCSGAIAVSRTEIQVVSVEKLAELAQVGPLLAE